MVRYAIGIDIGRTNLRAVMMDSRGKVIESIKEPTNVSGDYDSVVKQSASVAKRISDNIDVKAMGIGIAGQCDITQGVVLYGPNLFWPDVPFRDELFNQLEIPIILRNDVMMATMGEWRLGAGKGCRDMVALFVGTGIGGGAVVNGVLLEGSSGCGGHLGHISVHLDGPICGCGRRGCVEAYASGLGLASRAIVDPDLQNSLLSDVEIDGMAVAVAVERGDTLAIRLRDEAARALGSAMGSIINCFEPQKMILGGSVMNMTGLYDMSVDEALKTCLPSHREVNIVHSSLGEMAGAIGAALFALDYDEN